MSHKAVRCHDKWFARSGARIVEGIRRSGSRMRGGSGRGFKPRRAPGPRRSVVCAPVIQRGNRYRQVHQLDSTNNPVCHPRRASRSKRAVTMLWLLLRARTGRTVARLLITFIVALLVCWSLSFKRSPVLASRVEPLPVKQSGWLTGVGVGRGGGPGGEQACRGQGDQQGVAVIGVEGDAGDGGSEEESGGEPQCGYSVVAAAQVVGREVVDDGLTVCVGRFRRCRR